MIEARHCEEGHLPLDHIGPGAQTPVLSVFILSFFSPIFPFAATIANYFVFSFLFMFFCLFFGSFAFCFRRMPLMRHCSTLKNCV